MADVEMKEASSSKVKAGSKAEGASDGKKKFEVKKVQPHRTNLDFGDGDVAKGKY